MPPVDGVSRNRLTCFFNAFSGNLEIEQLAIGRGFELIGMHVHRFAVRHHDMAREIHWPGAGGKRGVRQHAALRPVF